ncbi:hypothetical protein KAJ27_01400 [bacterium]|nr:hypothetical protein [bacterium]
MKIKLISSILLTLLFILTFSKICNAQKSDAFPMQLTIITKNGVFLLDYNSTEKKYEKTQKFRTSGIIGGVKNDHGIFIFKINKLIKLSQSLKLKKVVKFKNIESIAANNKNIYISAEESFISLDNDLNMLGKVILKCHDRPKNAHDILLYHNTAYLLDNVVYPIFVFKVNIQNPTSLTIAGKVEFMGLNPHLDMQWLNPSKSQWNIVESFTVLGGEGQLVHCFPMISGQKENFQQSLYDKLRSEKHETKGFKIYATTKLPPIWAIVRNEKNKLQLANVKTADNKFKFNQFKLTNVETLDSMKSLFSRNASDYEKICLKKFGDSYLLTASEASKSFHIIDITKIPRIVFSQNFIEIGIHKIIDIF